MGANGRKLMEEKYEQHKVAAMTKRLYEWIVEDKMDKRRNRSLWRCGEDYADITKARIHLGYDPDYNFERGLAEAIDRYKANLK